MSAYLEDGESHIDPKGTPFLGSETIVRPHFP